MGSTPNRRGIADIPRPSGIYCCMNRRKILRIRHPGAYGIATKSLAKSKRPTLNAQRPMLNVEELGSAVRCSMFDVRCLPPQNLGAYGFRYHFGISGFSLAETAD